MSNQHVDAIYGRNSTERQEQQQTILTQLHLIRERFDKDGKPQRAPYLDEGWSGTLRQRPALNRLLADAQRGLFDRVLVANPSRLARGRIGLRQSIEDELRAYGVEVAYVSYKVDDSPTGRAQDGMQSVFDEWQREVITEAMTAGRDRRLAEGDLWRGPRTFGWAYIRQMGEGGRGHLEIVPEEAEHIRWMYAAVIGGKSSYRVADELNNLGITTARGALWTAHSVQVCLKNPLHSGHVPINRWEKIEPKEPGEKLRRRRKSSQRERPEADWVYVDLPVRIVDVETWRQAKAALTHNKKRSVGSAKHPYLLRGLLRCGHERENHPGELCGRTMTGRVEGYGRRVYVCNRTFTSDPTISRCCRGRVVADTVEAGLVSWLEAVVRDPNFLWGQVAPHTATASGRQAALRKQQDGAAARLAATERRLDALLDLRLAGEVDRAVFERKQVALLAERGHAEEEIAFCKAELAAGEAQAATRDDLVAFCQAASGGLGDIPFEQKQKRLGQLIEAVWVMPDGTFRLQCAVPPPGGVYEQVLAATRATLEPTPAGCAQGSPPRRFTITLPAVAA